MTSPTAESRVRLVAFEVELIAAEAGTPGVRWNGELMPSKDASDALSVAVDAFQEALRERGFAAANTGYGVRAVNGGREV